MERSTALTDAAIPKQRNVREDRTQVEPLASKGDQNGCSQKGDRFSGLLWSLGLANHYQSGFGSPGGVLVA